MASSPSVHRLNDAALLRIWESVSGLDSRRRSGVLLQIACPELEDPDVLRLGEANRLLIEQRMIQFGDTFQFVDQCPHCGEGVEFTLPGKDFLPKEIPTARDEESIESDGWRILFRPLTLGDWRASDETPPDPESAARRLLTPAVLDVEREGESRNAGELPRKAWEALSAALAEADPWAEIYFDLSCPACEKQWEAFFEPAEYFLREIENASMRLLHQIRIIAGAFAWREADILALTPTRRQCYVRMIEAEQEATSGTVGGTPKLRAST